MNVQKHLIATTIALALGAVSAQAMADTQRFVVDIKNGADIDAIALALQDTNGLRVVNILDELNAIAIEVDLAADINLDALRSRGDIVAYGIDPKRYPSDLNIEQETPYGIDAVNASALQFDASAGIGVCIIDSGFSLGHPDLPSGSNVHGQSAGAGPWDADGVGHGTHVAGTIAALDNGMGVVGVIPTGDLDLHIVRVFDDEGGFAYASDIAGAMLDCAAAGSDVVNMSLGSSLESNIERRAAAKATRAGLLLIAAAGNNESAMHHYPSSYDEVMSVAAVDEANVQAYFSQYNSQVEISGPGVEVLSTYPGGWAWASGTSMATPHVTGVAALVWSNHPECSNNEIREALTSGALDLATEGYDYSTGWGLVQADVADAWLQANPCKNKGPAK